MTINKEQTPKSSKPNFQSQFEKQEDNKNVVAWPSLSASYWWSWLSSSPWEVFLDGTC